MKLKKAILCFLALCILVCTCGCALGLEEIERAGVEYEKHNNRTGEFFMVSSVGCGYEVEDTVYIPDKIDGIPVIGVGFAQWGGRTAKIWGAERVYFPWSIEDSPMGNIEYSAEVKYIISASVNTGIDYASKESITYVVPSCRYNNADNGIVIPKESNRVPGNITYSFNYEAAPNKGYFFVDLVEETGKLTKPPYDPKRVGYEFRGWYKDPGCEEEWDFENDVVEIKYDENGNRIYEEIFLYAWWYMMF